MGHISAIIFALHCICSAAAVSSEYQQESQHLSSCELKRKSSLKKDAYIPQCTLDGKYRNIQCTKDGRSCWCVNSEGDMVTGSNQNTTAIACLSFCQLHRQQILLSGYVNSQSTPYIPQCTQTGEYEVVQCSAGTGQCWCVDSDGMEIYGTRQNKHPDHCPSSCEIRDRQVLHGFGIKSPPQCSRDRSFLDVQCRFVSTADMTVFDLVNNFNRFPDTFRTFSAFRQKFANVSGYCYCADRLGRELQGTGLELLLDEIYDSIFTGPQTGHTFTETGIYRILRRRFLAVQMLITGRFRCPTRCEIERFTAASFDDVFTPSCDDNGNYLPIQCQKGGQCWCSDSNGEELLGTRQQDRKPNCGDKGSNCESERKRTLSWLFYGPVGHFSQNNIFTVPASPPQVLEKISKALSHCSPDLKELLVKSDFLVSMLQAVESDIGNFNLEGILGEFVEQMFLSKDLALTALQFSATSKFFIENMFGGKFLKNVGHFNFTGSLGSMGTFNFSQFFQQIGLTGMYSGGNFVELAKLFSPLEDSYLSKGTAEFSRDAFNLNQTILDNFGRAVNLQQNQNIVRLMASLFEQRNVLRILHEIISFFDADDGSLSEIIQLILRSARLGICDHQNSKLFVPRCTRDGHYEEVQCQGLYLDSCVDNQRLKVPNTRVQGQRPQCSTPCEQQRKSSILMKEQQPAGSDVFVPSCGADGGFLSMQCDGMNCFCVDLQGRKTPGIRKPDGKSMKCPSACQLLAAEKFIQTIETILRDSSPFSTPAAYIPQCRENGDWRRVQCDGPPFQVISFYHHWISENKGNWNVSTVMDEIIDYHRSSQASISFELFLKELYDKGHQYVFPVLSPYPTFDSISADDFEALANSELDVNVLLHPYTFWQLLFGHVNHYPGSYSDFSVEIGDLELRKCWCVDEKGQELPGTKAELNQTPQCPGSCALATAQVLQFIDEADELIFASNNSEIPFTQGFLLASGIHLTESELLHFSENSQSDISIFEKLLSGSDYAIRLAAQSTLEFYQKNQLTKERNNGESTLKGYIPYIPQCNGFGNWEPIQCYERTGHCWCVDEIGSYIPGSLVNRLTEMPQCLTPCQRSQTNAALAGWKLMGPQLNTTATNVFEPTCNEVGEYNTLQWPDSEDGKAWCIHPDRKEFLQMAVIELDGNPQCLSKCDILEMDTMEQEAGPGYIPSCDNFDGSFSTIQCDQDNERCWCVFENGDEVPETQVNTTTGLKPACKRPRCVLPFKAPVVTNGIVLCDDVPSGQFVQHCQVKCRQGYQSVFGRRSFVCNVQNGSWITEFPHPESCQRIHIFQVAQVRTQFQLDLPSGKACSGDYSGLLKAFNTFITDDLTARGFCQLQVSGLGEMVLVPVCDNSTVSVGCLSMDRLGVNVTWKVNLSAIPASSLPDLRDIENALLGEGLVKRFTELINSGKYHIILNSKQFPAANVTGDPMNKGHNISPFMELGCTDGYQRFSAAQRGWNDVNGCIVCPAGSFFQDGRCILCPPGFYQETAGNLHCNQCPLGRKTVSPGTFLAHQCLTECETSPLSLQCDLQGQYKAAQQDSSEQKSFCVTTTGVRLVWTEINGNLSESDCIVFRQFDSIDQSQLILNSENTEVIKVLTAQSNWQRHLLDCLSECSGNDMCNFLTLVSIGDQYKCELYNSSESNFLCKTFGQSRGFLGNSATVRYEGISCELRINSTGEGNLKVYRKKGQEFTTSFHKTFVRTDYRNVNTGVYKTIAFSADASSLTNVHHFCRQTCGEEQCCDGFVLSQLSLDRGTLLCGLISYPDVLFCNVDDWQTAAALNDGVCGGVNSNTQKKILTSNTGGQEFSGCTLLCGQVSFPNIQLCNVEAWQMTSTLGDGICRGVKSNKQKKTFMFNIGGQEFGGSYALLAESFKDAQYSNELTPDLKENFQRTFNSFQHVYLWQDSDMNKRLNSTNSKSKCSGQTPQDQRIPKLPETTKEFFSWVDSKLVQVDQKKSVPNQHYQLFKHQFPIAQAELWCLERCTEENFCKVISFQDSGALHYECTLYPDTQLCQPSSDPESSAVNCSLVLSEEPQAVYRKKDMLKGTVKNFYTRLPFRQLQGFSVRKWLNMRQGVQAGFFECERLCDEDSCCKGFGFLKGQQASDSEITCLTLNSFGVQYCSEEVQSWNILECESAGVDPLIYPFGWYQKPVSQWNPVLNMCPEVSLPPLPQKVSLNHWQMLKVSPVLDSAMTSFDILHISSYTPVVTENFMNNARDWCLSACASNRTCATVSLHRHSSGIRCIFYPDTHSCQLRLRGHHCRTLLKEAADVVYLRKPLRGSCAGRCGNYQPDEACQCNLKCEDYADCCPDIHTCTDTLLLETQPQLTSILIPGHGILFGESQDTRVGVEWKAVNRFLGVPYAAPPTGEGRFKAPASFNWTGQWNATFYRPSCLQPGNAKAVYSTVDEDCLYLNIFVPKNTVGNIPVLIFFHNSAADYKDGRQSNIDGSYLASAGNIVVVTANYRVGVFGFLSDGTDAITGNWGLLDQMSALQWLQRNIGYFGGSPSSVTIAGDRSDADITSMNLIAVTGNKLFQRALLLGGSALSPSTVMSKKRAQEQVINLAKEVGCPTDNKTTLLSCLRGIPALTLNTAQTKLLSISGPFQTWGPIVDGIYLRESPLTAFPSRRFHAVDLMIGSAEEDGLVRRSKAIMKFEETSGKSESKTAFYQALENALGGEASNSLVKDAASWFYSLQQSLVDYSAFSRALENATRDFFIICPVIKMATQMSNSTQANVFMYHIPRSFSQPGASLSSEVQFVFGLPLHPDSEQMFTVQEQSLSLTIIQYIANFVKSGNPNYPFTFSRKSADETLPLWLNFFDNMDGSNYKEFANSLENKKGLKKAECSFWSDYVPMLQTSTGDVSADKTSIVQHEPVFQLLVTQRQPAQGESY
ncbi:thyroglobulin [Hypanus sabinus]|uniref:thyroglobulin n=1 Tax=Hypanus sabinus TaxID=79690 RepID=UPI0028C49BD0|nr:thyroglobulin [Hypanus sabinus]